MTDTRASRSHSNRASKTYDSDPQPSGWVGWIAFASSMMILLGSFQAIQGFVAIFDQGFYHTTESGLVVNIDYTAWGWTHLLLGVLVFVAGGALLVGQTWARVVGVGLAVISAAANMVFVAAYPWWSITVITLDVLIIYALIVHGREMRSLT
jgi:hypothetical protein